MHKSSMENFSADSTRVYLHKNLYCSVQLLYDAQESENSVPDFFHKTVPWTANGAHISAQRRQDFLIDCIHA